MSSRLEASNPVSNSDRSVSDPDHPPREPLAIIGIGCRFPGGLDSPPLLWNALLRGVDAICDVPQDRWDHAQFHDTNPEKFGCIRNAKGGFIDGIDLFDGEFFGYFPATAQRIDPQQRLLLEVTHEAMEDAGIRRDQLSGSRTAVFIGSFMYDYLCIQAAAEQRDEIGPHVAMGTGLCSLANRISYDFNLTGPSVSLDTACSASLTALHLACQSVWGGESEMAIAGGVNVMLRPESSIILSKAGFLNPDQACKAFDESANGYVRGEGVGVVIVKPLHKAMADGDSIYASIRGTGANQDGYMPEGFTVPNVFSQIALLESVYAQTGIDPSTVDYVEAHGTGTPVGDPIEASALGSVLGCERSPDQPNLIIGSVKTNLGHLEGASGIAGFIKGVLTAHHGVAPPNLHFTDANPEIPWEYYRLEVPTRPTPLNGGNRPLTVGVNSFGAGGANAHVVLQTHSETRVDNGRHLGNASARTTLYILSATNRDSLRLLAQRHADFLRDVGDSFDDVAYSAFTRRSHYPDLLAVVGENREDVEHRLRSFADGEVDPEAITATITHNKRPKIGFIFSGQGGQWPGMGLELMKRETVFRDSMEEIDASFQRLAGWSILEELRRDEDESKVNDTIVVQPAVMAIQISLVKLYEHYGIRPQGVVGHSIGEVAAGFAAGALTLEKAIEVIYRRSQAQSRAAGNGGMLAVGISLEEARDLLDGIEGISVGAINGPEMLTLTGDLKPLERVAELLDTQAIFNRRVNVEVAYHSHHMEPIKDVMMESLADVRGVKSRIPLYSTVTGGCEAGDHLNADYWYQNVRQPVLFNDAIHEMSDDGFNAYVEIGPHPVLVRGAESLWKKLDTDSVIAPSMTRKEPEATVFLQSLARLAARGLQPDLEALFGPDRRYVRLPQNPWKHQRYWFESPAAAKTRRGPFRHPFLKRTAQMATEDGMAIWDVAVDVKKFPYLHDHRVDGEIVFPATGHMELAWAAASEQFRTDSYFLENLQFDLPLILPNKSRHPLNVRLEITSDEGDYRICSRPTEDAEETHWTRHSSGRINRTLDQFEQSSVTLDELKQRFRVADVLPVDSFYETISGMGLAYGEKFQCIQELRHLGHEVLASVRIHGELKSESQRNSLHPSILDACIHALFADVHRNGDPHRIFLPYRCERVQFHRRPSHKLWAYLRVNRNDDEFLNSDTLIFDEAGELVAEVCGLVCKRLVGAGSRQTDNLYEGCYEYRWEAAPRGLETHRRVSDCTTAVIIADKSPAMVELTKRLAADGIQPHLILPEEMRCFDESLVDLPLDRRTLVVFAAGLSTNDPAWKGLASCPAVPSFLQLAQTLHDRDRVPRLFVVTNGAAGVDGDEQLDLGQAILHGMSRVIRNECPHVPVTVIDLSATIASSEVDALHHELLHGRLDRDESEIAIRGNQRYVRQLVAINRDNAEQMAATNEPGVGGDYRADVSVPGALDQIGFRRNRPIELGDEDVEIAVQAAALNFKDIMNAMGLLPEHAVAGGLTCDRLGLEVAGRVLRAGSLVRHVETGDEVIARVAEGFCGRVITPGCHTVRRPEGLTTAQAAAIPVVSITAYYSLCYLARLTRGETVLVHSAAGGVGGAAIQLAIHAGATVIATAGTQEKRERLRKMGVEHVFDSRSLEFYNHVMEVTDGRGVDIVLNSLTGRFIAQSLKCLAPFGRFVELGKSDIYRNNKLGLERFGENISYFAVDVDRLAAQKPELHQQIMTDVVAMFDRGELVPHDITEFPISKLPDALRFMSRAAYTGKIVMNMQDDRVHTLPPRVAAFRPDRSYLISGGAGGFGLEIARWMVDRGACHLVLLSRSGCKTVEDQAAVDAMKNRGVQIAMPRVDITDAVAVGRIVQEIEKASPPLAGVIHGAAVMDDASIPAMTMDRFESVFNPKAQGAWNLHQATLDAGANLDFFALLSSISSVLGFVGQINYVAANFFEDALAHYRRQQGLCATSVNLGVLGQYAGLSRTVNESQDVIALLESQGLLVMSLGDILGKFEATLLQKPVQRLTAQIDWPWFRMAYPHLARDSRFIEMIGDEALERAFRTTGSGLRSELSELAPEERLLRLQQELAGSLARILDADKEKLDVSASIDNLGLDSLMLTELQIWIGRLLEITLPLIKLLKGPSITSLATDLLSDLERDDNETSNAECDEQGSVTFTIADVEGIQVVNPWLIRGTGEPAAPVRLICFHSMGVGASLFTKFLLDPIEGYDILAVQTPGRENRANEPVAESVDQLADQIAPQLRTLFDRPVVFWGHSFGGIVAREVIRRLRENEHCEPAHFVVTGTIAPHLIKTWQNREVILKSMVADNTPEYLMSLSRYVDDADLVKAILPGLRRDAPLLIPYRYQEIAPLTCPITAFAARQDDVVYSDEVAEWSQHTDGGFQLIEVDGDHWFIDRNRELITATLQKITDDLQCIALTRQVRSATQIMNQ